MGRVQRLQARAVGAPPDCGEKHMCFPPDVYPFATEEGRFVVHAREDNESSGKAREEATHDKVPLAETCRFAAGLSVRLQIGGVGGNCLLGMQSQTRAVGRLLRGVVVAARPLR